MKARPGGPWGKRERAGGLWEIPPQHLSSPCTHGSCPPMPSVCPCMTPACQHILPISDKLSASSHHISLFAAILTYPIIKALTIRFISESSCYVL